MLHRHRLGLAIALLLALVGTALPAAAQQIIVMVNGEPITTYDVTQRQRLAQVADRKSMTSKQALDDLIEQRLKIQQTQRMKGDFDEKDIDRMYASVAQRSGRTSAQLTATLAQSGIDERTFKNKIAADYIWSQYVRARSGNANVRDADVAAALQKRGMTQQVATEYVLRPIIFVVARNSRDYGKRLGEANALRARFRSCDSGLDMARSMREVVVRPQVVRLSSDMPPALQKILDKTPVGQLTAPEVTQSGVETFAICDKRQVRGESSEKREIKDELSEARFKAASDQLMEELRKSALIQYRR